VLLNREPFATELRVECIGVGGIGETKAHMIGR
jgi:hypothetical protein